MYQRSGKHPFSIKVFAVQFYGECWGSQELIQNDKYVASENCWEGVGMAGTNAIYIFKD